MRLRVLLLSILAVALSPRAASQTTPFGYTNNAFTATGTLPNSTVRIVSGATIRVCTEPASGTPCTPLATIYTDATLAHVKSNPFQADTLGNYTFFVPAGTYHVQQSGPQVAVSDIPYIQLGAGGGGGGTCPSGQLYDIQINDPLGTCGSDPGIGYLNPNIHELGEWTGNFAQQVDVSDTTHSGLVCQGHSTGSVIDSAFCTEPSPTFSPTPVGGYGLFPPDNVPSGVGQSILITSLTSTPVVTKYGTIQFYPTHWGTVGSAVSAENRFSLFNNLDCNSPATCVDIPFTPIAWAPSQYFKTQVTGGQYGSLVNSAVTDDAVLTNAMVVTLPNVYRTGSALVFGGEADDTVTGVSDSCSNTWTRVPDGRNWWYATAAVACETPDVITGTLASTTGWAALGAEVFGAGVIDAIATSNDSVSGNHCTMSPVTTTQADVLVALTGAHGAGGVGYQYDTPGTGFITPSPSQIAVYGGSGLGASRYVFMEYGPAATVGAQSASYYYNSYSVGVATCSDDGVTIAFKPSTTDSPQDPAPGYIRYLDMVAGGDFSALAQGNLWVWNGAKSVPMSISTGLHLDTTDPTTYVLTATTSAPTIYLSGTDSGSSGTNYVLTSGNLNANSNSCPASLTTGVTATIIPANANTSTTPTFQLCGLSSAATIVKGNSAGQTALVNNDLLTTVPARLQYDATSANWILQNPLQGGAGVTSFTGDGVLLDNSASTGAVTAHAKTFSADNIYGNFTAGTATPSTQTIPSCAADGSHALTYASHTLTCTAVGAAGSVPFSGITGSTNTTAAMVVGAGATLAPTSATVGVISANQINGTALSGLSTGILRNTTTTGVPSSSELSGDATTSGSNAVTVVKVNGASVPASTPVVGTNSSRQIVAGTVVHVLSFSFGAPGGTAITTGPLGYFSVPLGCSIAAPAGGFAWSIAVDAGTATVKTIKKATGSAIPTIADSISTSGVAISSGTVIQSSTLSDFTTTTITTGDIVGAYVSATSGVGYINFQLVMTCAQ